MLMTNNFTGFGGSSVYDPYFANVTFLAHGDQAAGTTTVVDSSARGLTFSRTGSVAVSATSKFGIGALDLSLGGYWNIATPTPSIVDINTTASWTIEAWVYRTGQGNGVRGIGDYQVAAGATYWAFGFNNVNQVCFYWNDGTAHPINTVGTLALTTWTHIAASCLNGTVTMYINGSADGTPSACGVPSATSGSFILGNFNNLICPAIYDDIRITKGIARYTSNFTIPTDAFPNS